MTGVGRALGCADCVEVIVEGGDTLACLVPACSDFVFVDGRVVLRLRGREALAAGSLEES